jgi:hypothetical protein
MKSLLPFVKSYIKNSTTVIQDINGITLLNEARLFSADADSIKAFIQDIIKNIPQVFPMELFLEILEIIVKNNIFSFGDSHWLQLSGTAMGTPTACLNATVS